MTPPKMPIHIGDYKRDTGHLRAAEHGAYLLLLFHHWSTGALPNDDRQLSAIACMSPSEWKRTKPILAPFFQPGWIHGRVIEDLKKANESYEKLASAGAKGGKARAERKRCYSEASSDASQSLQPSASDALPTDNRLPSEEDRIVDARATRSAFTEASSALSAALWRGLSIANPLEVPPELAGADWRAIEWASAGWHPDMIEVEARRIGPGKPLKYYEKCFASAFAKLQEPLPIVEVRQAETLTVKHGKPPSAIIQAADNLRAKLASFDGRTGREDGLRGREGEAPPRLLSNG